MKTDVFLHIELPARQATALQEALRQQLRQGIQELWYADRFRLVPEDLRTGAILAAYPALAAQKKTLGALQAAIQEQK